MYVILLTVLFALQQTTAGVWPSGGTLATPLRAGVNVDLTWDQALHAERIDLELWDGVRRRFTPIAAQVQSQLGRYTWTIPQTIAPGGLYRIVIRDSRLPKRAEFSLGFHEIHQQGGYATTVEPEDYVNEHLLVTPLPADEKARIAWTAADATHIDVVDVQGNVQHRISPPAETRACVLQTNNLGSGQYSVVLYRTDGVIETAKLVVAH